MLAFFGRAGEVAPRNGAWLITLAAVTALFSAQPAHAQGRTTVVVAPILVDDQSRSTLPSTFAPDILRREMEVALEATQLFAVPSRDSHELDAVLKELILTRRRSIKAIPAQFIIAVTVEDLTLAQRRRVAPRMKDRDLVSVSGSMALAVTVLRADNAAVQARMSIDTTYESEPRLEDPLPDEHIGEDPPSLSMPRKERTALTRDASPADFLAVSRAAARNLANRVLEQVNPVVVIAIADDQVFLSRGEDAGYSAGQTLRVFRKGADLKDPRTGEVLDRADTLIGRLKVVETRPRVTVATVLSSTKPIDAGDLIREDTGPGQ